MPSTLAPTGALHFFRYGPGTDSLRVSLYCIIGQHPNSRKAKASVQRILGSLLGLEELHDCLGHILLLVTRRV